MKMRRGCLIFNFRGTTLKWFFQKEMKSFVASEFVTPRMSSWHLALFTFSKWWFVSIRVCVSARGTWNDRFMDLHGLCHWPCFTVHKSTFMSSCPFVHDNVLCEWMFGRMILRVTLVLDIQGKAVISPETADKKALWRNSDLIKLGRHGRPCTEPRRLGGSCWSDVRGTYIWPPAPETSSSGGARTVSAWRRTSIRLPCWGRTPRTCWSTAGCRARPTAAPAARPRSRSAFVGTAPRCPCCPDADTNDKLWWSDLLDDARQFLCPCGWLHEK